MNVKKPPQQPPITFELKEIAYQRLLSRSRRHFKAYERTFSRIIHQPSIDAISGLASRSIGRPSGILGGGLVSLIGTIFYYAVTRHYGYSYNFSVFVIFMVAGFLLGWTVELLWRLIRRSKKS
jgi:hypothetical protein